MGLQGVLLIQASPVSLVSKSAEDPLNRSPMDTGASLNFYIPLLDHLVLP